MSKKTPTQRLMECEGFRLEYGIMFKTEGARFGPDIEIDFEDRITQSLLLLQLVEHGRTLTEKMAGAYVVKDEHGKFKVGGGFERALDQRGRRSMDRTLVRFTNHSFPTVGEALVDMFEKVSGSEKQESE